MFRPQNEKLRHETDFTPVALEITYESTGKILPLLLENGDRLGLSEAQKAIIENLDENWKYLASQIAGLQNDEKGSKFELNEGHDLPQPELVGGPNQRDRQYYEGKSATGNDVERPELDLNALASKPLIEKGFKRSAWYTDMFIDVDRRVFGAIPVISGGYETKVNMIVQALLDQAEGRIQSLAISGAKVEDFNENDREHSIIKSISVNFFLNEIHSASDIEQHALHSQKKEFVVQEENEYGTARSYTDTYSSKNENYKSSNTSYYFFIGQIELSGKKVYVYAANYAHNAFKQEKREV